MAGIPTFTPPTFRNTTAYDSHLILQHQQSVFFSLRLKISLISPFFFKSRPASELSHIRTTLRKPTPIRATSCLNLFIFTCSRTTTLHYTIHLHRGEKNHYIAASASSSSIIQGSRIFLAGRDNKQRTTASAEARLESCSSQQRQRATAPRGAISRGSVLPADSAPSAPEEIPRGDSLSRAWMQR